MNTIATFYIGEHGRQLQNLSMPRLLNYSQKCGSPLSHLVIHDEMPFHEQMMLKMERMAELLSKCERVLWIDADILIRADAPSLFDIVPPYNFAAVDEAALANDDGVAFRLNHVAETCKEEGLEVPEVNGRYFNGGLLLANSQHTHLFKPRITASHHSWCEQSLLNARLALSRTTITSLPDCFNRFVYWGPKPRRWWESSYFLHYAGAPSPEARTSDMQAGIERWEKMGL